MRVLPSGESLTLDGVDSTATFSRYEASQNFNLVDVGALFIAGPFGPLITKGYDFGSLFVGSGGSSRIRVLVSGWRWNAASRRRRTWRWRRTRTGSRSWEPRFRQRTVQRCHRGGGRRGGMRQGAPEDPRPFPETGGGEGERPENRRGARCSRCSSRREKSSGGRAKCSTRLGGAAEIKKEQTATIIPQFQLHRPISIDFPTTFALKGMHRRLPPNRGNFKGIAQIGCWRPDWVEVRSGNGIA